MRVFADANVSMISITQPGQRTRRSLPAVRKRDIDKPIIRSLDITIAIVALIFISPLLLVVIVVLAFEGGPVIFAHRRVGLGGNSFYCLKFRSMVVDAEERLSRLLRDDPEAQQEWLRDHKLRNDPRITRFGPVPSPLERRRAASIAKRSARRDEHRWSTPDRRRRVAALRQTHLQLLCRKAGNNGNLAGQRPQRCRISHARSHGLRVRQIHTAVVVSVSGHRDSSGGPCSAWLILTELKLTVTDPRRLASVHSMCIEPNYMFVGLNASEMWRPSR
jgi:hypothetical protein